MEAKRGLHWLLLLGVVILAVVGLSGQVSAQHVPVLVVLAFAATGFGYFGVRGIRSRALRISEARYRGLFEEGPLPLLVIDEETLKFLAVNQAALDKYGYTRDEFLSMTIADLQAAEGREQVVRQIRRRDPAVTAHYVRQHATKGGQIIQAEVTARPLQFDGRLARAILVHDVSDRVRAEAALRESEQRHRDLFDLNPSAMWVYDAETLRILAVNEAALVQYGYTKEEFAGMTTGDLHPVEDVPALLERLRSRDPQARLTLQERHRRKDGGLIDVEVNSGPIALGGRAARLVVASDIGERKSLDVLRAQLAAIVENSNDAIVSRSLDRVITSWNAGAERLFGYTAGEAVGRSVSFLIPPEREAEAAANRARLERGDGVGSYDTVRLTRDGRRVDVSLSQSPIRDEQGRLVGASLIFRDITERKRAEYELRRRTEISELLESLARAANEAASAEEGMRKCLEQICEQGGWALGRLGIYGPGEGDRFPEQSLWQTKEHARYEPFIRASLDSEHFRKGGHFISRVLLEKIPVWLSDISAVPGFGRMEVASACGFRSAFAFPVIVDGEVAAFLEFFSSKAREPDRPLLEAVTSVGAQLARLIERGRALAAARELAAIVESSQDAIISTAPDRTILTWNSGATRLFGYTPDEAIGRDVSFLVPEELRNEIEERRALALAGNASTPHDTERVTKNGRRVPVSISASPIRDASGSIMRVALFYRDITERKRTELALRDSEEQFRQLAGNIPQIFWISDAQQREVLYVSPAYEQVTGRSAESLRADAWSWLEAVHEEDRVRVRAAREKASDGNYDEVFRLIRADGQVRWVRDRAFPVQDVDGAVRRIAGIAEDITDRRETEETLTYLAHFDNLTNLPNRVLFYDRLKQVMSQAKRNNWIAAVMFLDLDRFKNVNDTLGHGAGDLLLRQVSERLVGCVRTGDTVGRLSGDEFAVVLADLSGPEDASLVAQKIMATLAKPFNLYGKEVFITTSIGITLFPTDSLDQDTLLRNADTAMYRAKDLGRNSFRFYTPEMNERALEKLSFESSLRRALERQEFLLHFQPKVSLASGEVTGVEALMRWRHPDMGLIPPVDFMSILEETGLIVAAGEWVIRTACAQIASWERAGVKPMPVAVNLSARQFQSKNLGATISRILEEEGVRHDLLELEITESALAENADEAAQTLASLNSLGVRVAIDDFGTGYSSLSRLKGFPIDRLKIDGSFVRDVTTDPDDAAITRAIITMAHSLDIPVVAEGVETAAQLGFLQANECDEIQGYYFASPLPPEDFEALIRSGRRLQLSGSGDMAGRRDDKPSR